MNIYRTILLNAYLVLRNDTWRETKKQRKTERLCTVCSVKLYGHAAINCIEKSGLIILPKDNRLTFDNNVVYPNCTTNKLDFIMKKLKA